jgi:hypothetical protein
MIDLASTTYFLPTMQKVSKKIATAGKIASSPLGLAMTFWSGGS